MRYTSFLFLIVLLLAQCNMGTSQDVTPTISATPISTSTLQPTQPVEPRDVTIVSTSKEGNHVNTVTILKKGEWVVMTGTGGTLTSEDLSQDMAAGNRCFIVIFIGPTTLEYSIEVKGDDYFLAYSDFTEVSNGPEEMALWFAGLHFQNDFCQEGIERYRVRPNRCCSVLNYNEGVL